jgi:hypothetical protein
MLSLATLESHAPRALQQNSTAGMCLTRMRRYAATDMAVQISNAGLFKFKYATGE